MKKLAAVIAVTAFAMAAGQASAQQSPWQIRARVVNINPVDKSDPVGGAGASDRLTVSDKSILEADISYFFSPNWAAELILTYPQRHKVALDGVNIGTFKHLPPTLTLQYHFMPAAQINPYVGAGINYTRISNVNLLNGTANLDRNSFGLALQAGVDVKLNRNWSLNFDVKKIQIRSDVTAAGTQISRVKVDPLLFGVGVGYRF